MWMGNGARTFSLHDKVYWFFRVDVEANSEFARLGLLPAHRWLNGKQVWDNLHHTDDVVKERYGRIGFGADVLGQGSQIRITKLKLSRS